MLIKLEGVTPKQFLGLTTFVDNAEDWRFGEDSKSPLNKPATAYAELQQRPRNILYTIRTEIDKKVVYSKGRQQSGGVIETVAPLISIKSCKSIQQQNSVRGGDLRTTFVVTVEIREAIRCWPEQKDFDGSGCDGRPIQITSCGDDGPQANLCVRMQIPGAVVLALYHSLGLFQ